MFNILYAMNLRLFFEFSVLSWSLYSRKLIKVDTDIGLIEVFLYSFCTYSTYLYLILRLIIFPQTIFQ